MADEDVEVAGEEDEEVGEGGDVMQGEDAGATEDEGGEEEEKGDGDKEALEEEIQITDSQVMIQLKEAEEEAEALKSEIAALRREIDDYQCRPQLTEQDEEHLSEIQKTLVEKVALLDELTKRIAKLMEFAAKMSKSEDTTVLDEEEESFPDDLLPRVVICSSWDDMMPKVVVCMDMKKPGAAKKTEGDRDENGLTPEQREALEKERRCMAEERNRLQYQIACMEGEMRVMMRENDMLGKKVAQLKAEMENQPPFEFEMSVSAAQAPGTGCPKAGNMNAGYGVMGPQPDGNYKMAGVLAPGAEFQGKYTIPPPQPPSYGGQGYPPGAQAIGGPGGPPANFQQNLPCGGVSGVPGVSVPCPKLQPAEPAPANPNWPNTLPPYGKKCRKEFNAQMGCCGQGGAGGCGGGGGAGGAGGYGGPSSAGGYGGPSSAGGYGAPCGQFPGDAFGAQPMKARPPVDLNFRVNVQPQNQPCDKPASSSPVDTDSRSNRIAQQLQEIEMELRRMQRELCKAKKDKETLKAQQATLNCAKNYIM